MNYICRYFYIWKIRKLKPMHAHTSKQTAQPGGIFLNVFFLHISRMRRMHSLIIWIKISFARPKSRTTTATITHMRLIFVVCFSCLTHMIYVHVLCHTQTHDHGPITNRCDVFYYKINVQSTEPERIYWKVGQTMLYFIYKKRIVNKYT